MERNNTALTGVKKMIADRIVTQEAAEKYFPELKESEDEKILRVLKEGFEIYNKGEWYGGITNEQILAWLEKQGEQKPAWSEDDEGICRAIINDIANDKSMCTFDISKGICDEQINWLKSLKDRVTTQPKQEWSEEDEEEANYIADFIENLLKKEKLVSKKTMTMENMIAWLRDIKYCYLPKPEQGWSEEDDAMIKETLYFLREYQQSNRCKDENGMQNSVTCENWLKSLKERVACEANCTTTKQWKPSERQFQSIRDCALNKNIDADTRLVLDVLYQDLLKLREK